MTVAWLSPVPMRFTSGTTGANLGNVIRIVEKDSGNAFPIAQSNVLSSNVASFDNFRTIKKDYSMLVRFEIVD